MLERIQAAIDAMMEAHDCLHEGVGKYGKEEASAWIWVARAELEAVRRECDPPTFLEAARQYREQREAARWPLVEGEMRRWRRRHAGSSKGGQP